MSGIAIFGITGRMGQTLVRALRERGSAERLHLVGALASPRSGRLGSDAAAEGAPTGVMVTADPRAALRDAAVAVDFSLPQCVADNARACMAARVPLLVGATGFDGATRAVLDAAAAVIPVLIAPNTSMGVNLLARLVKLATRALGPGYDVEISEAHHRMKRDAPSGTALALGEVVAGERGVQLADVAVFDRHGLEGPRRAGDIGFTVLRAGDIVGEHTVTFATAGERVEITHRATDRVTFAHGALRAAAWLPGRPPGLYAMDDVLGLDLP
jgi:4-hydroxy-tetrahydrodipicolinate reductase